MWQSSQFIDSPKDLSSHLKGCLAKGVTPHLKDRGTPQFESNDGLNPRRLFIDKLAGGAGSFRWFLSMPPLPIDGERQ